MTSLLENPVLVVVIGVLLTVVLCGSWVHTGRSSLLLAAGAAILLTIGGLAIERAVVTDREQVSLLLKATASQIAAGDVPSILNSLHSTANELKQQVETGMQQWDFDEIDIKRNLEIEVQDNHQPPQAVATFNVLVRGHPQGGGGGTQQGLVYVTATLWKEGDRWRFGKVVYDRPTEAFRANPTPR